jgi:FxLD family lantipeptide
MSAGTAGAIMDLQEAPGRAFEDNPLVDEDFELDMRVVESVIPISKLMCATSDGCGSSCCSSACNTRAADPFSF